MDRMLGDEEPRRKRSLYRSRTCRAASQDKQGQERRLHNPLISHTITSPATFSWTYLYPLHSTTTFPTRYPVAIPQSPSVLLSPRFCIPFHWLWSIFPRPVLLQLGSPRICMKPAEQIMNRISLAGVVAKNLSLFRPPTNLTKVVQ